MIGTVLSDRYEITEKIGSGGSADVYLANDLKLRRKVAIKVLSRFYASDRSFVVRFKKEAQILAKLNDPNIVSIFDWGQFDNSYFICMEYVEGLSLAEIIEKQGIIKPITAAKYSIQICNALEVAHKNNLIHRDIKPQNIIVTSDGTVKITDFGIAKSLLEDSTKTLNILGTSYYISPEQAQGKTLSYSTDLYSLGIVLYEMLTADVPFRGENSIEISLKHINETPIKPSILVPEIPKQIDQIVMKCLNKDPDKRYESASELKSDLINFLRGKPLADEKQEPVKSDNRKKIVKKIGDFKLSSKPKTKIGVTQLILYPIIAILLVLSIWSLINYNLLKNKEAWIEAPYLINMNYVNAEKLVKSMGLNLKITDEDFNDNIPEGNIISQIPEEGTSLKKNTEIQVSVSKGQKKPESAVLPNLTGLNVEEARKIISDLGFYDIELKWETSDYFQKDFVIKQEPEYFETAGFGEKVILYVSSGKNTIIIPNIIGYDYMTGISSLEALGLNVIVKRVPDMSLTPGTVTDTYPLPGSEVPSNSYVSVFVTTSEDMIEVPDITKLTLENAVSILESMNIGYEIGYSAVMHSIQKNTVLLQYPEAGNYISLSEKVLLLIGN